MAPILGHSPLWQDMLQEKKIPAVQRKEIDDALMLLFIKDFQTFSVVEDKGFRKFVSTLNPTYQFPNRKHISNTMLTSEMQK
jgi:hypothetical protein